MIEETGIKSILLIQPEWLNEIFYNSKRAELRTKNISKRGPIGLGWRGRLYGVVDLMDCIEISQKWKEENVHLHRVSDPSVYGRFSYAWLLGKKVKIAENLIEFEQPNGTVVWVTPRKKKNILLHRHHLSLQRRMSSPMKVPPLVSKFQTHTRIPAETWKYKELTFFYATSAWKPTTLHLKVRDFERHICY